MPQEKSTSSKKKKGNDDSKKGPAKKAPTASSTKGGASSTHKSGSSKKKKQTTAKPSVSTANKSTSKANKSLKAAKAKPTQSKVASKKPVKANSTHTSSKKAAPSTCEKGEKSKSSKKKAVASVAAAPAAKPKPAPSKVEPYEEETPPVEADPSAEVEVAPSTQHEEVKPKVAASLPKEGDETAEQPQGNETDKAGTELASSAEPPAGSSISPEASSNAPETSVANDLASEKPKIASSTAGTGEATYVPGEGEGQDGQEKDEEFTKPTINQIKKEKKERPLSLSEKISKLEFETLNDEITELNQGVAMLKHSYGSIIKSLVGMQNRRSKKKAAKEAADAAAASDAGKMTFLTTLSTMDTANLPTKSCLELKDKYDIERFVNPVTREDTFKALFEEVEDLSNRTAPLRNNFYDVKGNFLRDKYDAQLDVKVNRTLFNEYKVWTKQLMTVVDDIARNYNDDLLNMFRLN